MDREDYMERTCDGDPAWEKEDDAGPEMEDQLEQESDAFSDDEEDSDGDVVSGASAQKEKEKNPWQKACEEQFLSLYQEYFHPSKPYSEFQVQCQLDDLYALLVRLNRGWAYKKAQSHKRAGFLEADGEDALACGGYRLYDMLKKDREAGREYSYPIRHYLKIARNASIDAYFRPAFGRFSPSQKPAGDGAAPKEPSAEEKAKKRKVPFTVSLDAPVGEEGGRYLGEQLEEASVDPFAELRRSRGERDDKSDRLAMMFLRELMDYPDEPPKPLALMYGNVLFSLYKHYGGDDELARMAKASTKVSSPEWAHKRMGAATLRQLGIYAERIVQKCFDNSLTWGADFQGHMKERTKDGSEYLWANIIYTETYTAHTSHWIESILKSTIMKCSRKVCDCPELREYAMDTMEARGRFRTALEKMDKEGPR